MRRKTIQKDFQRLYLEHTEQMRLTLYEDEGPEVREDFATKVRVAAGQQLVCVCSNSGVVQVSDWYFNFRVQYKQWPEEVVDFLVRICWCTVASLLISLCFLLIC